MGIEPMWGDLQSPAFASRPYRHKHSHTFVWDQMAAPAGIEPTHPGSSPGTLPLGEGALMFGVVRGTRTPTFWATTRSSNQLSYYHHCTRLSVATQAY